MESLLESLMGLNWENIHDVNSLSQPVLQNLATDKDLLRRLLSSVITNPELLSLCEHYDILDKIVLHNDKKLGLRVRLHIFSPGYLDRPHNHRWSYSSLILHGSYEHFLYGSDEGFNENTRAQDLKPIMFRREGAGSSYTLHHSMIHSIVAEPYTVSLLLRGPASKDRFLVTDKKTNETWWQYGAKDEKPEDRAAKVMSVSRLEKLIEKIYDLGLV